MPKRKESCTLEEDLNDLIKKVKKLEKKIRARKEPASVPPVPPDPIAVDEPGPPPTPEPPLPPETPSRDALDPPREESSDDEPTADKPTADSGTPSRVEQPEQTILDSESMKPPETSPTDDSTNLDADVLEILGDDPTSEIKHGPETRKEIASRFQHIATEGLTKEVRKELIKKYPLPANCTHVGAPTINPEIKAALSENVTKKDKGIEFKQKQMSSAISCLTEIITLQLEAKEKNNDMLQKIMDIGRILCDIQYGDSMTRRKFILFSVKNDMQEHLKSTKIDTSLFGEKLSDTLKSAKAVNKSGADLKADNNKTDSSKKPKTPASQPLNRRAAPPRRPPGAAKAPRSREPARPRAPPPAPALAPQAPPPTLAYRTSSTQPPPPTRRRY